MDVSEPKKYLKALQRMKNLYTREPRARVEPAAPAFDGTGDDIRERAWSKTQERIREADLTRPRPKTPSDDGGVPVTPGADEAAGTPATGEPAGIPAAGEPTATGPAPPPEPGVTITRTQAPPQVISC